MPFPAFTVAVLDKIIAEKQSAHPSHALHPSNVECRAADLELQILRDLRTHVEQTINGGCE